jgi:tripartite-type tricarboxylate transporter receptor subunit TctC
MTNVGRCAALGGLLAVAATGARAAEWLEKPVTWIAPATPCSPFDAFGRPVAAHLSEKLGQSTIIDNRRGAGGTIDAGMAARAPVDGYTMLLGATSITYLQSLHLSASFDFARDFVPISALVRIQIALVVNRERLNVSAMAQFVEAALQKPDSIEIATPGVEAVPHLAAELLQSRTGIKLHHVPYRNGAQALRDTLSGQVAATWINAGAIAGHLKDGKVRVLAIAGGRREVLLPDVPTMGEAGLKDLAVAWFALFAPKRTPEAILDRMHDAVQAALAADGVKAIWAEQGAKVELESRAGFTRFVDQEAVRWNAIATAANIQLEQAQ